MSVLSFLDMAGTAPGGITSRPGPWPPDATAPRMLTLITHPHIPHLRVGQPLVARLMSSPDQLQAWLLRLGLAFVFSYATLSMLVEPTRFTSYMPSFLPAGLVETFLLPAFSVFEAVLALYLVTGRRLVAVSLLSAGTMLGIIVVNPESFEVLFRNVAIGCAALALAVHARHDEAAASD